MTDGRWNFFYGNPRALTLPTEKLMPKEVALPTLLKNNDEKEQQDEISIPTLLKCPIGLDLMTNPVMVKPCKHNFEEKNIKEWRAKHDTCPCCRGSIIAIEVNHDLKEVIEYCQNIQGRLTPHRAHR